MDDWNQTSTQIRTSKPSRPTSAAITSSSHVPGHRAAALYSHWSGDDSAANDFSNSSETSSGSNTSSASGRGRGGRGCGAGVVAGPFSKGNPKQQFGNPQSLFDDDETDEDHQHQHEQDSSNSQSTSTSTQKPSSTTIDNKDNTNISPTKSEKKKTDYSNTQQQQQQQQTEFDAELGPAVAHFSSDSFALATALFINTILFALSCARIALALNYQVLPDSFPNSGSIWITVSNSFAALVFLYYLWSEISDRVSSSTSESNKSSNKNRELTGSSSKNKASSSKYYYQNYRSQKQNVAKYQNMNEVDEIFGGGGGDQRNQQNKNKNKNKIQNSNRFGSSSEEVESRREMLATVWIVAWAASAATSYCEGGSGGGLTLLLIPVFLVVAPAFRVSFVAVLLTVCLSCGLIVALFLSHYPSSTFRRFEMPLMPVAVIVNFAAASAIAAWVSYRTATEVEQLSEHYTTMLKLVASTAENLLQLRTSAAVSNLNKIPEGVFTAPQERRVIIELTVFAQFLHELGSYFPPHIADAARARILHASQQEGGIAGALLARIGFAFGLHLHHGGGGEISNMNAGANVTTNQQQQHQQLISSPSYHSNQFQNKNKTSQLDIFGNEEDDEDGWNANLMGEGEEGVSMLRKRMTTVMQITILDFPSTELKQAAEAAQWLSDCALGRIEAHEGVVDILTPSYLVASFNFHKPCAVRHARLACECALSIAAAMSATTMDSVSAGGGGGGGHLFSGTASAAASFTNNPNSSINQVTTSGTFGGGGSGPSSGNSSNSYSTVINNLTFSITIDSSQSVGGTVGTGYKRAEAITGEGVDTVSKLVPLTNILAVPILITERVQRVLGNTFETIPVDVAEIRWFQKERQRQVTLYELRAARPRSSDSKNPISALFNTAFSHFRRGELQVAEETFVKWEREVKKLTSTTLEVIDSTQAKRLKGICTTYRKHPQFMFPKPFARRNVLWQLFVSEMPSDPFFSPLKERIRMNRRRTAKRYEIDYNASGHNIFHGSFTGSGAPLGIEATPLDKAFKRLGEQQSAKVREQDDGLFSMFVEDDDDDDQHANVLASPSYTSLQPPPGHAAESSPSGLADFHPSPSTFTTKLSSNVPSQISDISNETWTRSSEPIGAGGFSEVFLGLGHNGQLVAMKFFLLESTKSSVSELENEVTILSKLSHDNIVSYVSCAITPSHFVILMEYVSGGSLEGLLKQFGPLPLQALKRYLADILHGLQYLHSQGSVHCDVKPHNALLHNDGVVKLTDFGSSLNATAAQPTTGNQQATTPSSASASAAAASSPTSGFDDGLVVRGTPHYMAPEAAKNDISPASDVWSVGITVLELCTGKLPWSEKMQRMSPQNVVLALSNDEPPMPEIDPNLDEVVKDFAMRCLVIKPQDRCTIEELLVSPLLAV